MEENSRESNEGAPKSIIPGGENDYFVCNICLGSVHDPVVTLCGHLYCWPCIYQRLRDANQPKTCLICNAEISLTSLVPLFGRGVSNSDSVARSNHMGLEIPPRPIPNNLTYMPTFPTNAPTYHQNQQLHDAASFPFPFHSNEDNYYNYTLASFFFA
ncbi:unnamed protein product [Lupinus luteus]|uniref:E3 ubiquitin-protein ligase RMA n=1 Tax=Lupinus luteus TaxID=3873 RepID=A0AAV1Y058_LUPLU